MTPLIAVVGPTASGKSDLALELAEQVGGEIVNCDSLQLYRYMNIGTAKTPVEERRGIPHHLLDVIDPDEVYTAGDYQRAGRAALAAIAERGRIPVVAGGTGFYLRALLEGLGEARGADAGLRARLAAKAPAHLHRILEKIDKISAARIHPNDTKKVIRAIELCLLARRPRHEVLESRQPLGGFAALKIALLPSRSELGERIEARCKCMFESGIIEETHFVVGQFGRSAKALEAIGYAQAMKVLDGELSREKAEAEAVLRTRQYAKRQMTWFRKETNANQLLSFGNQRETIKTAIRLAHEHIKKFELYANESARST